MLEHAALVGLASVYIWYLVARAQILDPVLSGVRASRFNALLGCPWCAGFWITGAVTLVTGYNILTHLAAAAVVGVIGGFSE